MSTASSERSRRTVTRVIREYLAARETQCQSPSGAAVDMAEVGALVQTTRRPRAPQDRLGDLLLAHLTADDLRVLAAYYAPEVPAVLITGYCEELRREKRGCVQVRVAVMRRRDSTDAEVADQLGCSEEDARRALRVARAKVYAVLARIAGEEQ